MVMKVGTLVLCHLIISGSGSNNSEKNIKKVPGIIKEITEIEDIEMMTKDYAVKTKVPMLLVQPMDKDEIFRVRANACRPVVDEATHLKMTKEKLDQKKKTDAESAPMKKENSPENQKTKDESPPIDSSKEKLLKELE